jgi:ELWxxDGT repeat protein
MNQKKSFLVVLLLISGLTASTQSLFKDIFAGSPSSSPSKLTSSNGKLFFFAQDVAQSSNYMELWVSNGTAAGTTMVKNINPSEGSIDEYSALVALGAYVYFVADDGNGSQLWRSDGTSAGTIKLTTGSVLNPENLTACNGSLFFSINSASYGRELWKTNGTVAGTTLVNDFQPGVQSGINNNYGNGSGTNFADVNGTLYLVATDGFSGYEIYKSNGTAAGSIQASDLLPGNNSTQRPQQLTACNGKVFFTLDGGNGTELYVSDGTIAGSGIVTSPSTNVNGFGSQPKQLFAFNNELFFIKGDEDYGREIWKSNGTNAGTTLLKDIGQGTIDVSYNGKVGFCAGGSSLYFIIDHSGLYQELWKTSGTSAGTSRVAELGTPVAWDNYLEIYHTGGKLFFSAHPETAPGYRLFVSNGTEPGTVMASDNSAGTIFYNPRYFCEMGGKVYFSAEDENRGVELWVMDPVEASIKTNEAGISNLSAYPNPASSVLTLSLKHETASASSYKILNTLGTELKAGAFAGSSQEINVAELPAGIYFVEVKHASSTETLKVIKD